MKKILSFVLAFLMLASLAVSATAANFWGKDNTVYVKDDTIPFPDGNTSVNSSLSLYHYLMNYKPVYGNNLWWNADLAQWWYDSCEKCGSYALYYVEDGAILWKCLKAECDGKGTMQVPGADDETDKDETTPSVKDFVCSECKTNKYLVFVDTVVKNKALVHRYYCLRCENFRYNVLDAEDDDKTDVIVCNCKGCLLTPVYKYLTVLDGVLHAHYECSAGHATNIPVKEWNGNTWFPGFDDDDVADVIVCNCKGCLLTPVYKYLTVLDGVLHAHYECSAGHATNIPFEEWNGNTWFPGIFDDNLTVHVSCTPGGSYWMSGSSNVEYGEKRTIAFYPASGYVLTDVVINGVSYGPESILNLTVKKDTVIRAVFAKAYLTTPYTILGAVQGNGTMTAKKNNALANAEKLSANYYDTVTYTFTPDDNYVVSDVLIDGKSVGAVSSYTFTKLDAAHTVEVIFAYKNPFVDVKDAYTDAVRYVTEAGIMDYSKKFSGKCYFYGDNAITLGEFVSALVEMTDTKDRYDSMDERIEWALFLGLIDKKAQLTVYCDVQTACTVVNKYLSILESINEISFNDYDAAKSAKDNAIAINMVSEKGYTGNRTLSRYDAAAVCYLIAGLEYEG